MEIRWIGCCGVGMFWRVSHAAIALPEDGTWAPVDGAPKHNRNSGYTLLSPVDGAHCGYTLCRESSLKDMYCKGSKQEVFGGSEISLSLFFYMRDWFV